MVILYFQVVRLQRKTENFYITGSEKKKILSALVGFVPSATLCWKLGMLSSFLLAQEATVSFTDGKHRFGVKSREQYQVRKQYIEENVCNAIEWYKCERRKLYKSENVVK